MEHAALQHMQCNNMQHEKYAKLCENEVLEWVMVLFTSVTTDKEVRVPGQFSFSAADKKLSSWKLKPVRFWHLLTFPTYWLQNVLIIFLIWLKSGNLTMKNRGPGFLPHPFFDGHGSIETGELMSQIVVT